MNDLERLKELAGISEGMLRKRPVVNMNTNKLIKELIGDYNGETQDLIWAIADNESKLIKHCSNIDEYRDNIAGFIASYNS